MSLGRFMPRDSGRRAPCTPARCWATPSVISAGHNLLQVALLSDLWLREAARERRRGGC